MSSELLIRSLDNPLLYEHSVEEVGIIETHISWVVLTGDFAYKIKKPVKFCFLDYSTLDKRRHFCEEEMRLNSRTALSLYLGVVAITGSKMKPSFSQDGPPIEYAVKMRQFPQNQLFSYLADEDLLNAREIDRLASEIARLHAVFDRNPPNERLGSAKSIHYWTMDNFEQIQNQPSIGEDTSLLKTLRDWCEDQHEKNLPVFDQRRQSGFIRECHGDLHLNNIVLLDGLPTAFDGIEFNDELRWIDVISEIAYVVMDLEMHGQKRYAHRFLNMYLQQTGDYTGLSLLQYYLVYRALVVVKVRKIKTLQQAADHSNYQAAKASFFSYLQFASKLISKEKSRLIIMHGYSASGKSTIATQLAESMGAIQVRSDVERKRLYGFRRLEKTHSNVAQGIYTASASQQTYAKLVEISESIIHSGYSVIVDACFLKTDNRKPFYALAQRLQVPFFILSCQASKDALVERIAARQQHTDEPSEADKNVLLNQLTHSDPLDELEQRHCLTIDTQSEQFSVQDLVGTLQSAIYGKLD